MCAPIAFIISYSIQGGQLSTAQNSVPRRSTLALVSDPGISMMPDLLMFVVGFKPTVDDATL